MSVGWNEDALIVLTRHSLGGWAASTVDALDTMILMGLTEQYEEALPYIAQLTFDEVSPEVLTLDFSSNPKLTG